ncbi:MAG: T9SS type A sorting domain-containing protein [Sphingobacteriales bacterium]|nr:T9SS type A sorting domain-containing protein [Sphingobacteriales bacterium]
MNWFIESAGLSNVTNIPTMFYGIGAVNTGGTDSSYVPLQSAGILAVKFSDFSVTTRNDNALLNWIVEEESTSTDRYEVERSTDGKYFSSFSTISVSNSYGKRAAYTYNDNNISALSNSGSIYYRVKQIDKDGQSVNSSVQKITISAKDISVMPNPVKNIAYVTYSLSESTPVFISVLNSIGTELQQFELQGFIGVNNQKIDMGAYPAGAYLLKIRTGNQVKTFTIMKVN